MRSYYDGLRALRKEQWKLSAAAQLVLRNLYEENNGCGNSGWIKVSDRELQELTNYRSKRIISAAKEELREKGFIEYESGNARGGTRYELLFYTREEGSERGRERGQSTKSLITRARKTQIPPPAPAAGELPELEGKIGQLVKSWRQDPNMPWLTLEMEKQLLSKMEELKANAEHLERAIRQAWEKNTPDEHGHRKLNYNYIVYQLERVVRGTKKKAYVAKVVSKNGADEASRRSAAAGEGAECAKGAGDMPKVWPRYEEGQESSAENHVRRTAAEYMQDLRREELCQDGKAISASENRGNGEDTCWWEI